MQDAVYESSSESESGPNVIGN